MAKKGESTRSKPLLNRARLSKEVQARLSAFVNSSTEGFALLDENLDYMFINPVAERMIGVSRETVVGKNILDIVPNVQESGRYDKYVNVLKTGKSFHIKNMVSHTKFRDIHASLKAFRVENWLGLIATDITGRREVEEALEGSEQKYRDLFNTAEVALFRSRIADGKILECNDLLAKLFGYDSREQCMAEHVTSEHYVDHGVRAQIMTQMLENAKVENLEAQVTRRDGSPFWVSYSAHIYPESNFIEGAIVDITERKKLEEESQRMLAIIQEDKDRLLALINSIMDEVWFADIHKNFTLANLVALREFGYSSADVVDIDIEKLAKSLEVYNPDGSPRPVEEAPPLRALKGETLRNVEEIVRTPVSGELRHRQVSASPVRDINGNIIGAVSVVRDITESKRVEEALRESEVRFRELFENMSSGVAVYEAINEGEGFIFKDFNKAGERIDKIERGDVIGKSVLEVFPRVKDFGLFEVFRRVWRTGNPEHHPISLYKDGRIMGWRENYVYKLPSGEIAAMYDDVTERKKAEEALKESEEKYRALIEATGKAGEGIIIIQDRGEREAAFVFVNDEFCRMSGYAREELLDRSAWDLVPYEIAVRLKNWYKLRHMGEATPGHYEAAGVCKDGTIVPLDLSVVTMPWQGKIAMVLYMRDITERKRLEDALRESEQTIRRLAKASASAHEEERQRVSLEVHDRISQTLTAAFHQLQALESIPIENTEAQPILKRASALLQESIRESRNIMEDLYSPVLSDFGIVAVIDEELRRFREETGCRTKFDKRCTVRPTRDVELAAYRIFREALTNIKTHAIGATEVKVSLSDEAEMVSLQVKDNGPGFDVEAAMLNKRVGGLKGMQRRAELGGGIFEVVSSRGHGTTVTVRLPCTSASDEGKEEKTP